MVCSAIQVSTKAPVYRASVVQTLPEFEALAAEWTQLLQEAGICHINLEHGWMMTWLQHFPPHSLFVVTVRDEFGKLVGAAPFKISYAPKGLVRRMLRHVQFIGTDPTVYEWMKIVVVPEANEEQVLTAVARRLMTARSRWDVIDLQFGIARHQMESLSQALSQEAYCAEMVSDMAIPYISLPKTCREYRSTIGQKHFRKDIQRVQNALRRNYPGADIQLEIIKPSQTTEPLLMEFFRKLERYWQERGVRCDITRFPRLTSFYRDIFRLYPADEGGSFEFRFSLLKMGEHILSSEIGFWQHNAYTGHLATFETDYKKYRPGILHIDALIQDNIERGGQCFDFGRGDESYKSQWNPTQKQLWTLRIFGSRKAHSLWQLESRLKQLLGKGGR